MSLESSMKIAVVLSAYDKMSGTINQAVNKAQAKLNSFAKKADNLSDKSFKAGQQMIAGGIAIAAPLVAATKKAMDFEDAMADVAKVANLDRASQEFKNLSSDALKLSGHLATNASDVGALYSSLLSGGTALGELSKVAQIAGQSAVAFDMTQEAAGNSFMTMKNAMALSVDETKKAFDATNAITNQFGGKASEILMYMSSGGASVARTLKATAPEMEAFGRALMQSGVAAGEAGTVMERFRVGLYKNAEAKKLFDKAGAGADGIAAVFQAAQKTGDPFKWFQAHNFGQYSSNMALLSGNMGNLKDMLKFVGDENNYADSALKEFQARAGTTSFKIAQLQQAFYQTVIEIGNAFLPTLKKLSDKLIPIVKSVSAFVTEHQKIIKVVGGAMAVISALALTVGYFSFAFGGVIKLISFGAKAIKAFTFIIGIAGKVFKAFQLIVALGGGPILLIIAAIAAAAFLIYKYWDNIKVFFIKLWDNVKRIFSATWNWIKNMFLNYTPQGLIIKHWAKIAALFSDIWNKVKAVFMAHINFVSGLGATFFNAGKNIVKSIWEGIKSMAHKPIEAMRNMVGKIRNMLPFSPAKDGPLKDIHRIRLVETIAQSIKASVLVNKMQSVAKSAASVGITGGGSLSGSRAGGVQFIVNVHLSGSATQSDADRVSLSTKKQFERMFKQYSDQKSRVAFG